uniref:Uncharacterized protein n=1 Tax=Anolis carolinensis TaxID=28377 RepID=A0A803TU02_ANOCA
VLKSKVDDLLRCGICFDYFNIAMIIPQCSHNCKYRSTFSPFVLNEHMHDFLMLFLNCAEQVGLYYKP